MSEKEKKFLAALRYSGNQGDAVIKKGLEEGISADICDENGVCALSYAIHSPTPNWKLIDLLLEHNVDLDKADTECLQMTPLMHAILSGEGYSIRELLKRGADRAKRDVLGLTAFDYLVLLQKDDELLDEKSRHYTLTFDPNSIYDWAKSSDRQFPYYKYYENLHADSADSCPICKHFRNRINGNSGEIYIETGIPGVYLYNRIVYQLFKENFNNVSDGDSWRTYQQQMSVTCPVCKSSYYYKRWWDEEWMGMRMSEEFYVS